LGITTAQIERAKKLLDAGTIAKGALLDIQAQLATEEYNNTTAQNQLDIAYLTLAQLLNMPSAKGLTIAKPVLTMGNETLLTSDPNQIYTTAIATLPQIKKAENEVKSAEKGIDIAWGGLSPRLSFSAAYGTGYSGASQRLTNSVPPNYETIPYLDQYRDNVNKSFGFYLYIPIFNRFQTKFSIDRARIQKINAELAVENAKLQIEKEVEQSYADANAGLKKFIASEKAVTAIQESFNYTEQKFNVGIVNTNDYNDAKNKLIKAQSDLLQAKYEYIFKIKVLDFYQGKPLKL
jgi:outer membrane protein